MIIIMESTIIIQERHRTFLNRSHAISASRGWSASGSFSNSGRIRYLKSLRRLISLRSSIKACRSRACLSCLRYHDSGRSGRCRSYVWPSQATASATLKPHQRSTRRTRSAPEPHAKQCQSPRLSSSEKASECAPLSQIGHLPRHRSPFFRRVVRSCATLSRSMPSLAAWIRRARSLRPGETLTITHHPEDTLSVQEHDLGVGAVQRKVPFVPTFRAVLKPYAIRTVMLTAGLAVLEPHLGLLYL